VINRLFSSIFCRSAAAAAALLLVPAFGASAQSGKPVDILMPLWGPSIETNGSGLYVELLHFILRGTDHGYRTHFVDYDDLNQMLLYGGHYCAYPISKATLLASIGVLDPESLLESRPVLVSHTHAFSREGEAVLKTEAQLRNKLLIQIRGENYNHNESTRLARFWNVDSELRKVEVLLSGRGDAMLGSMPEILFSFEQLGIPLLPYDPDFNILSYRNALTCRAVPGAKAIVEGFSRRVDSALADGALRQKAIALGVPEVLVDSYLPTP